MAFSEEAIYYIFIIFLEAAGIVRMIAVAVAHLHAMNLAHRDLKVTLLENILFVDVLDSCMSRNL